MDTPIESKETVACSRCRRSFPPTEYVVSKILKTRKDRPSAGETKIFIRKTCGSCRNTKREYERQNRGYYDKPRDEPDAKDDMIDFIDCVNAL